MKQFFNKYESLVQIRIFAIIIVLLSINVMAYYVVYEVWTDLRSQTEQELRVSSSVISEILSKSSTKKLSESLRKEIANDHSLKSISYLPLHSDNISQSKMENWLRNEALIFDENQLNIISSHLLKRGYNQLTQGNDGVYHYVTEQKVGSDKFVLILSKDVASLAFLDKIANKVVFISSGAIIFILGLFLFATRFILSPYKRISEKAEAAGRSIKKGSDDVEELVREYGQIIDELKEKEAEAKKYSDIIQQRYDQLENFNQYLLSSLSTGVMTFDKNLTLKSINNSAEVMLRISSDDSLGNEAENIFRNNLEIVSLLEKVQEQKSNLSFVEISYLFDDKSKISVGLSIASIFDNDNNYIGIGMLLTDTTELNILREKLESNKRFAGLGEMTAGLAHQLRNSMGAITGFCSLMGKQMQDPQKLEESISALKSEAAESEELIQKFLNFTRPFEFSPEQHRIKDIIGEIVGSYRNREDCKNISFDLNIESDITHPLDSILIKQSLKNIIDNAIKAFDNEAGLIELSLEEDKNQFSIIIKDNACGISESDLEQIFTPFYSSNPLGTGLGLPLAKKIIDLHQGKISVSSTVGSGTTFQITFQKSLEPVSS